MSCVRMLSCIAGVYICCLVSDVLCKYVVLYLISCVCMLSCYYCIVYVCCLVSVVLISCRVYVYWLVIVVLCMCCLLLLYSVLCCLVNVSIGDVLWSLSTCGLL